MCDGMRWGVLVEGSCVGKKLGYWEDQEQLSSQGSAKLRHLKKSENFTWGWGWGAGVNN